MIDLYSKFKEINTYKAYSPDNVYKCDKQNIKETIKKVLEEKSNERVLIEVQSSNELNDEIVNMLTDNIDVRIIGGLTDEYANSHKGNNMDSLREKATYSKEELEKLMNIFKKIEANIDPKWNDYEKALFLYEYIKYNVVYRKDSDLGPDGLNLDSRGNTNRTRTWDSLIGLINQLSTCSGFAHIFQELCARQNIKCVKVGGVYKDGKEGSHAWNVITINDKNYLVDSIWDAQEYEKGNDITTGFAPQSVQKYIPRAYIEMHKNLSAINPEWIEATAKKVSNNIPKDRVVKERLENFLKLREEDRKRMMYLREKQFQTQNDIAVGKEISK